MARLVRTLVILSAVGLIACGGRAETTAASASNITWESALEIASGDAWQGPWRMNESDFRYVDDPNVTGGSHGGDILFARSEDGARTFSEPERVHESSGHADAPALAVAGNGRVYLAWGYRETNAPRVGRIALAHSDDDGRSFGSVHLLDHGDSLGQVAAFPSLTARDDRIHLIAAAAAIFSCSKVVRGQTRVSPRFSCIRVAWNAFRSATPANQWLASV